MPHRIINRGRRNSRRTTGPPTSLDLKFAINKALPVSPTITFTRASGDAAYWDALKVMAKAASGVARFTHDPGTGKSLGLLSEGSQTELCLQTENLVDPWNNTVSGGVTLTLNAGIAPDGNATADKIAGIDETFDPIVQTIALSTATKYAVSVFMENVDSGQSRIRLLDTVGSSGDGDLEIDWTGGVPSTNSSGGSTGDIRYEQIGAAGGLYGVSYSFTTDAVNTSYQFQIMPDRDNAQKAILVWGMQLSLGDFPGSYIAATTGTVVRAAEVATLTRVPAAIYTKRLEARTGTVPGILWSSDDGTANERVYVERNSSNEIRLRGVDGGVEQFDVDAGSVADETDFTIAFRVGVNDIAISLDGAAVVTDTGATLPTVTTERLMHDYANANHWNATMARNTEWAIGRPNAYLENPVL